MTRSVTVSTCREMCFTEASLVQVLERSLRSVSDPKICRESGLARVLNHQTLFTSQEDVHNTGHSTLQSGLRMESQVHSW